MRIPLRIIKKINVAPVVTILLCTTFFVNATFGQKLREDVKSEAPTTTSEVSAPTPFVVSGNATCKDLNWMDHPQGGSDTRVSHIVDDWGLKIDQASPNFANVPFNNGTNPARSLMGGAPQDLTRTISMSTTAGNAFNWSSTKQITAVIVKGGPNGANVYAYKPFSFGGVNGGGTGLITPGGFEVSHVVFCFGVGLVPSSSNAEITGRVFDASGRPIRGAILEIWNVTRGEYTHAYTNSFGYYTLPNLPVSDFYVLTASHGRYTFYENPRSFTLNDDLTGIDFYQSY